MKKILILALLFIGCDENTIQRSCKFQMTTIQVSDASPIQFWLSDCDTYNQRSNCGIHADCFCQPFQYDDTIKIQFMNDAYLEDYYLKILDENGTLITTVPFVKTINYKTSNVEILQFLNNTFQASLSPWGAYVTGASKQGFAWDPAGALADGVSSSHYADTGGIYQSRPNTIRPWPKGDYIVKITAYNNSTGGSAPLNQVVEVYGSNDGFVTKTFISSVAGPWPVGGTTINEVAFTTIQQFRQIGFNFSKQGPGAGYYVYFSVAKIDITKYPTTELVEYNATYNYSFSPKDFNITDQQIKFEIWNDATPDIKVAHSDCIDVRTSWACGDGPDGTKLIEYSNHRTYAGLDYSDISPDPSFYLRIPAIFFHERFPETDEAIELSNSQIITTNSTIKAQKLLDTDFMPYYMHRKLKLILKHQFVTIDNQDWIKEESYDIVEGNRMFARKKARCFLTQSNFLQRNVI